LKKKILIVGSSGFLGTNFINALDKIDGLTIHALVHKKKYLNKKNDKVKYIFGDICNYSNLKKKIKTSYDFIFNFSGNINHKKNRETHKVHFLGVKNLIKIIKKTNSKLLVQNGSSLEYGNKVSPHNENLVCKPLSYYGRAKYLASSEIKKKLKDYIILRPYQIYGPHQKLDRLIPIIINSCIKNYSFPCSEGLQLRDFLYVDDFNNLLVKIIKKKKIKSGIYNVGSGKPLQVKKIINLILKLILKGKPLFGKLKMRKEEMKIYFPSIAKVKKNFHWTPKTNILLGLRKTINFYEKKR
jgi:nucleoside-diphosphate-sugar epimerase|tara:strand:+ start:1140 stop:2033 length:894 start_codon:yes stop_codon:yes gene_type:complete